MPEFDQVRITFESYLILAGATALPALALWVGWVRPRPLLPAQRHRAVPWSGFEILLILFFVLFFWPALADEILARSGFLRWLYGPDIDAAAKTSLHEVAVDRRTLWVSALAWPFQIATLLLLPRALSNTRAYQLGLGSRDWARNLVLGWIAWLILAAVVLACHLLIDWAFRVVSGQSPESHPLIRIFNRGPLPVEWILVGLSATVWAPALEELLFRGLLQPWCARREWGGYIPMLAALAFTLLARWPKLKSAWLNFGSTALLDGPVLFVLVIIAGYYVLDRATCVSLSRPREARAISGTALLFAMFHVNVWPTPIPLFLLGLGLGYLAYRTQSLVGPILAHALFNAVACVGLLLS